MKVPEPVIMPIEFESWMRNVSIADFANCYCQYNDLKLCIGARSVLIVGPGRGLATVVLKWAGYDVKTIDIDPAFRPDHVGSVHEMNMFVDGQFDAVIASHVLEHLAEPYLSPSLREIARVGRYALIYLPVFGRHIHIRLMPGIINKDWSFIADVYNYFRYRRTDGLQARFQEDQHYWEVGLGGFRLKQICRRMSSDFDILRVYRNRDWLYSQNFVLRSKRNTPA